MGPSWLADSNFVPVSHHGTGGSPMAHGLPLPCSLVMLPVSGCPPICARLTARSWKMAGLPTSPYPRTASRKRYIRKNHLHESKKHPGFFEHQVVANHLCSTFLTTADTAFSAGMVSGPIAMVTAFLGLEQLGAAAVCSNSKLICMLVDVNRYN